MQSKITQSLVERAPPPVAARPTLYADTEMRGFYLIVSRTKRSFYVQSLVNGRQVRTKLGDHPAMDAKQARDLARKTLVGMRGGTNPNEERRKARARGITLREALDLHLNSRRLADKTRSGYPHAVIAAMVNAQVDGAAATDKSVRWYANDMRKKGIEVPPRAKHHPAEMDERESAEALSTVTVVEEGE